MANTTEGGCPGGNEDCEKQEKVSTAETLTQSDGGENVDASYLWRKGFFILLLKTSFKNKLAVNAPAPRA